VLSHEEQRERLAVSCPEAVQVSVVAGDPCFDQLTASASFRNEYRRALGIHSHQQLIVVSSTWGHGSIVAERRPEDEVLRRVLAELPADEYRVLAAIHPNAWFGHGAWQLQNWLAPFVEQGLLLPAPDTQTWKAALVAADAIVGDHGSLTMYGAAIGIPVVLGSFASSKVADQSPMARLGKVLPRLSAHRPVLQQLEEASAAQADDDELRWLRTAVTSRPGEAAAVLRRLFYRWLNLPEPATTIAPRVVPIPTTMPNRTSSPVRSPMYVVVDQSGSRRQVRRYPAPLQHRSKERHLAGAHLVADIHDPNNAWPRTADVLLLPLGRPRAAEPANWS
jgi:hypothetical protein